MAFRTRAKDAQGRVAQGLEIGQKYVTESGARSTMETGRDFASLSHARVITDSGWYWISASSIEAEPREVRPVNGSPTYKGRTFVGVPSIPGEFKDNKDGTFTKLNHPSDISWKDRVHVSEQAAAKAAKGEGLLLLGVGHGYVYSSGLDVHSCDWPDGEALVASMPQAQVPDQSIPKVWLTAR